MNNNSAIDKNTLVSYFADASREASPYGGCRFLEDKIPTKPEVSGGNRSGNPHMKEPSESIPKDATMEKDIESIPTEAFMQKVINTVIKEVLTKKTSGDSYPTFKAQMLKDGEVFWAENPLNPKASKNDSVYHETPLGLELYSRCNSDAHAILSELGIHKRGQREEFYTDFINECRMPNAFNNDADHLIATPDGNVLDFDARLELVKDKKDPNASENIDKWRCPLTSEKYRHRFINMRTGVNYSVDAKPENGRLLLEKFFRFVFGNCWEWTFQETFQWILRFLGRLLLGKNTKKEFVTFIGEKDSGKTTFVKLLTGILGSYAAQLEDDDITKETTNKTSRSLYASKDKRLLVYSEGSRSQKINTQTLKRITGDSALSVKNIPFTVNGKIIEDSNYIPVPNIAKDQAFNDRLIIIPFLKNTTCILGEADRIIASLFEGKDDIFALMVKEATESIEDNTRSAPPCSEFVKQKLEITRNPVKTFYETICKRSHEGAVVSAKALYGAYHEWAQKCKGELPKRYPYLETELPLEEYTETAFNQKIQELHTHLPEHKAEGKVFTHLEIDKIALYGLATPLLPDPIKQQKINMLNTAEQVEKVGKAISDSVESNMELEKALAKKSKTAFLQYGAEFASFPIQPTWSYNPLLPVFPAIVQGQATAKKPLFGRKSEPEAVSRPNPEEPIHELSPGYFASKGGVTLQSYTDYVTPFDLPDNGSPAKADNYITPFDMD
jgi:energy-coupling factor transporter ATP-binding protein EcfA2